MAKARATPSLYVVVHAMVTREIQLASRRTLVRALFLLSLAAPIGFAGILMFRKAVENMVDQQLDWDPIFTFLRIQCIPLALLAFGLGAPAMIRDREEKALTLYAARPVTAARYALARILAVGIPVAALLLIPGWAMLGLRMGILEEASLGTTLLLGLKVFLSAVPIAWAYGALSVAAGAFASRLRWALLLALFFFIVPDWIAHAADFEAHVGPSRCAASLLKQLFETGDWSTGLAAAAGLLIYGCLGFAATAFCFRRGATP